MKIYTHKESEKFIKGLPVAKSFLVKKIEELAEVKRFPVVLKIISKQALHKTEISGVKIVHQKEKLKEAFTNLVRIARKRKIKLDGILLQEFVRGQELIVGIRKDNTFGHVIMFGVGGILVELLKDVVFRVCPISEEDANSMLNEIKLRNLLLRFRGKRPVNLRRLRKILVQVSRIPLKYPQIEELDINPLIANEKECKIVDVRVVCK